MLLTIAFFWLFSSSSDGAPHQPPVDHSRIVGLSSSTTKNATSHLQYPRLRGPGQGEDLPLDYSNRPQVINSHEHGGGNQNTYGHEHHDDHKVPKLNKLNIQEYITQRDMEKHRRKDATWKTYFAEILAAVILVCAMMAFLCWWNWSKRARQRNRSGHPGGMAPSRDKRRMHRQQTFQRGQSMPELYINVNPVPEEQFPKSSWICSPDDDKRGKARRPSCHPREEIFHFDTSAPPTSV